MGEYAVFLIIPFAEQVKAIESTTCVTLSCAWKVKTEWSSYPLCEINDNLHRCRGVFSMEHLSDFFKNILTTREWGLGLSCAHMTWYHEIILLIILLHQLDSSSQTCLNDSLTNRTDPVLTKAMMLLTAHLKISSKVPTEMLLKMCVFYYTEEKTS